MKAGLWEKGRSRAVRSRKTSARGILRGRRYFRSDRLVVEGEARGWLRRSEGGQFPIAESPFVHPLPPNSPISGANLAPLIPPMREALPGTREEHDMNTKRETGLKTKFQGIQVVGGTSISNYDGPAEFELPGPRALLLLAYTAEALWSPSPRKGYNLPAWQSWAADLSGTKAGGQKPRHITVPTDAKPGGA